jgi:G2/mitotic-specific cyclin 3/4
MLCIMVQCCEQPRIHHAAVFDKYSDKRYKRAAMFVENELNNGYTLPAITRERLSFAPTLRALRF